jgi:hypothetical protein
MKHVTYPFEHDIDDFLIGKNEGVQMCKILKNGRSQEVRNPSSAETTIA